MKLQTIIEDLFKEAQPNVAPIPYANNDGGRAAKASDMNATYNTLKGNIDTDQELIDFLKAELPQLKSLQVAKERKQLSRYAEIVRQIILKMDPDFAKK